MAKDEIATVANAARKQGYPQALQIGVYRNGRVFYKKSFGKKYKIFDVASLTKIMVTVPLIIKLYEEKKIGLEDPVEKYLGFLKNRPVGKIKIKDLLRHKSGLVWWRPYYKTLLKFKPEDRVPELKRILAKEKITKKKLCEYSDPDFILLGWMIEKIYGQPLDVVAQKEIFDKLRLKNTFYKPKKVKSIAPTRVTKLRGRICGEVDDDNAWAMNGVSGHAGVFSTLEDVLNLGQSLLSSKNHAFNKFTKRAVSSKEGDWALGFMVPSKPTSSAGKNVSKNAFGHTGFVGTSLWVDRKRSAVVVILSNRVHPTEKDQRFLQLRRDLHDAAWKMLDRKAR